MNSVHRTLQQPKKTSPENALPILNGRFEQYAEKLPVAAAVVNEKRRNEKPSPAITVISNSAKVWIHHS